MRERGHHVVMGGGYVSTELREADEPAWWDSVDALAYDEGETPLLAILDHRSAGPDRRHRTRTVAGLHRAPAPRVPSTVAAWYGDLALDRYLQVIEGGSCRRPWRISRALNC